MKILIKIVIIVPLLVKNSFAVAVVESPSLLSQMINQLNAINEVITNAQKQVEFANKINSTLNNSYSTLTSLNAGLADPTAILDTAKQNYESVKANLKRLEADAKNRDYISEIYGKQWNRCYDTYQRLKNNKDLSPEQQKLFDEGFGRILEAQDDLDKKIIGWTQDYQNITKENENKDEYSFENKMKRAISVREAQSKICKAIKKAEDKLDEEKLKNKIRECIDKKNTTCVTQGIDELEEFRKKQRDNKLAKEQAELEDILEKANDRLSPKNYDKTIEEKIKNGKLTPNEIQKILSSRDYATAIEAQINKILKTISSEKVDLRSIAIESLEVSKIMLKQQNEILQTINETNKAIGILIGKIDRRESESKKDDVDIVNKKQELAEKRRYRFDTADICYDIVTGDIKSTVVESSRTCKKANNRKVMKYN